MSRQVAALSLVACIALAGCSSRAGSLTAAGVVPPASAGLTPVVSVTQTAEASVSVTHGGAMAVQTMHSILRVVGTDNMGDDELADDAESMGFSILSAAASNPHSTIGKPVTQTGIVRKTEAGWSLETSKGVFKKTKGASTLTGAANILSQLADRQDKKAQIKGTEDQQTHVITVTTVKGLADMGFLTNWLSKGKITGTVTEAPSHGVLGGVKVQAKSADGFVFEATSDDQGEFEIKNLTPGTYNLTLTKAGYEKATTGDHPEEVAKREHVTYSAELAPLPAHD